MLDLENFMKLLEDAMPSEDGVFSIDEKIMSKRAARRRRLRAKKLAQQKAQQQAELEKEQEQNVENSEEKQEGTGTALVVYQDVSDEYDQITEQFTNVIQILDQANDHNSYKKNDVLLSFFSRSIRMETEREEERKKKVRDERMKLKEKNRAVITGDGILLRFIGALINCPSMV